MSVPHLRSVVVDEASLGAANRDQEHEREVAIFDLLDENSFQPVDAEGGPYDLKLSLVDGRLAFDISGVGFEPRRHLLSLTPLKGIIKDYFLICDSYYAAIRNSTPAQIEALDIGRRGLHNEGSDKLRERLEGKVVVDRQTARRLFTLICALHWRGEAGLLPGAVLFACTLNRVRSPMAAALMRRRFGGRVYVDSCGLKAAEEVDPFAVAVIDELGADLHDHRPKRFEALEDGSFDAIVTLSPEAHHRALEYARHMATDVVYWPTHDPTIAEGSRDARLAAYRAVRDTLDRRILDHFGRPAGFGG